MQVNFQCDMLLKLISLFIEYFLKGSVVQLIFKIFHCIIKLKKKIVTVKISSELQKKGIDERISSKLSQKVADAIKTDDII